MKTQILLAAFIVSTGFSLMTVRAEARDTALLNQALENSYAERAGLEKDYRANLASTHSAERKSQPHAIALEMGDELGGGHGGDVKARPQAKSYQEQAVNKKLDREWRDVKRSLSDTHKNAPDKAPAKESVF